MGAEGLLAMTAISGGVSAYGQYQAGQQAKAAYGYNAALAEQQAKAIQAQGDIEKEKLTREEAQTGSLQRVYYSAAGVKLQGTATAKMLDTASQYEMDKLITDYNTAVGVSQAKSQSQYDLMRGQIAASQGVFGAGQSLLTTALKISDYNAPGKDLADSEPPPGYEWKDV